MNRNITGNFATDIAIDGNELEDEWLIHPSKVMDYGERYVEAVDERDDLKMKLDNIHSNLYLDIKASPAKFGFDSKPSEAAIKAKIEVSKNYTKALKRLHKANKTVNSLFEAKKAFEHRKAALAGAVSLRITGVHSEPRNNIRDLKKQESINDNKVQKEHLNRRKKVVKKKKKKSVK